MGLGSGAKTAAFFRMEVIDLQIQAQDTHIHFLRQLGADATRRPRSSSGGRGPWCGTRPPCCLFSNCPLCLSGACLGNLCENSKTDSSFRFLLLLPVDYFSIDFYDGWNVNGTWEIETVRAIYESMVFPAMAPHQKAFVVPGELASCSLFKQDHRRQETTRQDDCPMRLGIHSPRQAQDKHNERCRTKQGEHCFPQARLAARAI